MKGRASRSIVRYGAFGLRLSRPVICMRRGRAYEYLIKQFADYAGAKGWRVLHPTRSCRHSGFEKEKPRYSRHAGLSLDSHETFQDFP
jgi:hypothetical protein